MFSSTASASQTALDSKSKVQVITQELGNGQKVEPPSPKGFRFWMVFVAICVSMFMSALEFASVSSALPTIANDLNGENFVWVASAYALASTALLPASGGMAQIFGRRATSLLALFLFALGSALCGAAQSMNWLIAARTVQGAGGGGILALGSIILSDLIPLRERGLYNGMIGLTWALAGGMGPLVGGAFAEKGHWRWLFYINLPISGVAATLILIFLRLRKPPGKFWDKMSRLDWIGNFIIITSSVLCVLGLTWGGVRFPWKSAQVLAPLVLGLIGMGVFLVYEAKFAKQPVVPFSLLSNRTSLSGYCQTFLVPMLSNAIIYYLPVYYQACKGASPIRSGVWGFGSCLPLGISLLLTGGLVQATKSYRSLLWIGWILTIVSMGTMSTLHATTPVGHAIGFTVFEGVGMGLIYSATYFPVLAPLPVSQNAHALAFFSFCRSFASVWGVTIGAAVLQTQLGKRLPEDFVSQFPQGASIAYTSIPIIGTLPEPLRSQVREAFAQSIAVVWEVMLGICGLGLLVSLVMKALPLHTDVDKEWGLEERGVAKVDGPCSMLPEMEK